MKIKALHNQTVLDLVLKYTGSIAGAIAFASANNLSITDDLIVGNYYLIPEGIFSDVDILNYYDRNGFIPATGNIEFVLDSDFGIGRMIIAQTFLIR